MAKKPQEPQEPQAPDEPQPVVVDGEIVDFTSEETRGKPFKLADQIFYPRTTVHPGVFLRRQKGVEGLIRDIGYFLTKEDRERFEHTLSDPDFPLDAYKLDELVGWLIRGQVERDAERPTEPPASSGDGEEPTGPTSEENSSEVVSAGTS